MNYSFRLIPHPSLPSAPLYRWMAALWYAPWSSEDEREVHLGVLSRTIAETREFDVEGARADFLLRRAFTYVAEHFDTRATEAASVFPDRAVLFQSLAKTVREAPSYGELSDAINASWGIGLSVPFAALSYLRFAVSEDGEGRHHHRAHHAASAVVVIAESMKGSVEKSARDRLLRAAAADLLDASRITSKVSQ